MLHLRVVAPSEIADAAVAVLQESESVCNVIHLEGVARSPQGDLILADVAREDASVLLSDLRELGLDERGSIALESVDTSISKGAERGSRSRARPNIHSASANRPMRL